MSDAATIRAGHAEVELGANLSQLASGLKTGQRYIADFAGQIAKIGASIAAAGAVVVAPFTAMAMSFAETGSDLRKMSLQTGIAIETLSALSTMKGIDAIGDGVKKMQVFLVKAAEGGKEANDTLAAMGLSASQLMNMTPDQQLMMMADGIKRIGNQAEKTNAIINVFGRSGLDLAGFLNRGSEGMQRYIQRAREMGLVMSEEDAVSAGKYKSEMKLLGAVMTAIKNTIGASVVPVLRELVAFQIELWTKVNLWIRGNRELITWMFRVGLVVVGVGAAIGALAAVIYGVSAAVGVLATVINAAVAIISAAKVVFNLMFVEAYGMLAILAALAVGFGFLIYVVAGWSGALESIDWAGFGARASASFAAISDAISAGDIMGAIRIMWLQIRLWWTQGTNWLSDTWFTVWAGIRNAISYSLQLIITVGTSAIIGLISAFYSLETTVANIFTRVSGHVASIWHRMVGEVLGAWGDAQERMGLASAGFGESFRRLGQGRANAAVINANATIEARDMEEWFRQQNLEVRRNLPVEVFGDMREQGAAADAARVVANQQAENDAVRAIDLEAFAAWFAAQNANVQRDMMAELAGVGAGEGMAGRGFGDTVAGTFSAAAISGFLTGGSTAADRTAAAAEEQRDLMIRLIQEVVALGGDPRAALDIL